MENNYVNDDIDSKEERLPVNAGANLLSAKSQTPLYEFQENEEIQLRDHLDVIMRRKWLIMTVLALTFLSTLVFTLASTKIYEATAVIEVNQATQQVTKFEEVLASKVQAREFYETQVELICSRAMINRVIDKLDLTNHPVIVETLFGDGRFKLGRWVRDIFKAFMPSIEKRNKRFSGFRGFKKARKSDRVFRRKPFGYPESQVDVDRCEISLAGPSAVTYGRQYAR